MARATPVLVAPAPVALAARFILMTGVRYVPSHPPAQGWMVWPGVALVAGPMTYSRTRASSAEIGVAFATLGLAAIGAGLDHREACGAWLLLLLPLAQAALLAAPRVWRARIDDTTSQRVLLTIGTVGVAAVMTAVALGDAL